MGNETDGEKWRFVVGAVIVVALAITLGVWVGPDPLGVEKIASAQRLCDKKYGEEWSYDRYNDCPTVPDNYMPCHKTEVMPDGSINYSCKAVYVGGGLRWLQD